WHDTLELAGGAGHTLGHAQIAIAPGQLPAGRAELLVQAVGAPARARAPLLVSLSDEWAVTNFSEMISMLRYFERQALVGKLHAAGRRGAAGGVHRATVHRVLPGPDRLGAVSPHARLPRRVPARARAGAGTGRGRGRGRGGAMRAAVATVMLLVAGASLAVAQ